MATIESALWAALTDTAGRVYGLVADRIYPLQIPQEASLPAMAYQRVSGPRIDDHGGGLGQAEARIQLSIVGSDYATAKAVAGAVGDLFPFRGILGGLVTVHEGRIEGEIDGYGPEVEGYTVRLDTWFLYAE